MEENQSTSSDSGSDNIERPHNVQCALIKSQDSQRELDPNYAYKQKLGDLIFNANFEAGNLGFVEQIDQFDYDLMVRPDVANPRSRLWFNFTVSNQRPSQCVVFTFVNLSENLILFNEGLTPVVRSREQPNWWRLDEDQVFYYKSSSHNNRLVLSVAFKFSENCHQQNEHQFALFYPYTFSALQSFISRWQVELIRRQKRSHQLESLAVKSIRGQRKQSKAPGEKSKSAPRFEVDIPTTSVLFKPIYLLNVGLAGETLCKSKPQVVLLRAASGNFESVTSLVCQGYLDFMLSDDLVARAARRQLNSMVVPMLDPDSICVGNSLTDLFGQSNIGPKLLESNPNVYNNFKCVRNKLTGSRIVGSQYEDSIRMERHIHLARLLSTFADGFYLEKCQFVKPSNENCHWLGSKSFNFKDHKHIDQYVLEVSPFAYYQRSLMGLNYELFDQKKYLLLGKALAHCLLQLMRNKTTATAKSPSPELLPSETAQILDSFHLSSRDIDDLTLTDIK